MLNVDEAVAKLESMASARPELKSVVDVAVQVVRDAQAEVERSAGRAVDAEQKAGQLRLEKIAAARRADAAELRAKSVEAASARAIVAARKMRVEKFVGPEELSAGEQERIERAVQKNLVPIFRAAHDLTKHASTGRSMVEDRKSSGPWEIYNREGDYVGLVETRRDATLAVMEQLELQKAADADCEPNDPKRGAARRGRLPNFPRADAD